MLQYEQNILKLQNERSQEQKRVFTKWINFQLKTTQYQIDDLFEDLKDGKILLKLLEVLSGEKLLPFKNHRMKIFKIENINNCLAFMKLKGVYLQSISAENIYDGDPDLILGLIWTIILYFQIQNITIHIDESDENSEKKTSKEALLLWCQYRTRSYKNVNIVNFGESWNSGLGFNALIHTYKPTLFDYDSLNPFAHKYNLEHAFNVAHKYFGIPKLLEVEDIQSHICNDESIVTYLTSYYHSFSPMMHYERLQIEEGSKQIQVCVELSQTIEIDEQKDVLNKREDDQRTLNEQEEKLLQNGDIWEEKHKCIEINEKEQNGDVSLIKNIEPREEGKTKDNFEDKKIQKDQNEAKKIEETHQIEGRLICVEKQDGKQYSQQCYTNGLENTRHIIEVIYENQHQCTEMIYEKQCTKYGDKNLQIVEEKYMEKEDERILNESSKIRSEKWQILEETSSSTLCHTGTAKQNSIQEIILKQNDIIDTKKQSGKEDDVRKKNQQSVGKEKSDKIEEMLQIEKEIKYEKECISETVILHGHKQVENDQQNNFEEVERESLEARQFDEEEVYKTNLLKRDDFAPPRLSSSRFGESSAIDDFLTYLFVIVLLSINGTTFALFWRYL